MNVRRLTPPLLVAFAVSGVCTMVLSKRLSVQAHPVATLQYIAPVHSVEAGDVIRPDNLRTVTWPANTPVTGAFSQAADVQGRVALYPIDANQPLTEKLVSVPGAGLGLASRIPDGMRAIALRSDEVMGVAGFLMPHSHVDVLVTYRSGQSPDPRTVTVLQDAEVIAAGHQVEPDPQGKPATVDVVTLLLAPTDAERAVLASTQGSVHFVLRSGSDQTRTKESGGIALSDLSGSTQVTPVPPATPPVKDTAQPLHAAAVSAVPAPRPMHQAVVEIINGDKQSSATFDEVPR